MAKKVRGRHRSPLWCRAVDCGQPLAESLRQLAPRPRATRRLDPACLLAPVPAVLVATARAAREEEGRRVFAGANLATFAWAGIINSKPPRLSISVRPERHTWSLLEETGEFSVNLVSEDLLAAADFCGLRSGRDMDKFQVCGLHAVAAAELDTAPRLAEAPLSLSCRIFQTQVLGSHILCLADILAVEAAEDLFDAGGQLHLDWAQLVSYEHGMYRRQSQNLGFFGYSLAKPDLLKRRLGDRYPKRQAKAVSRPGRPRSGTGGRRPKGSG